MKKKNTGVPLEKKEFLTPKELSMILGVFQTTILYWIRMKGLKFYKTPGGHYKVSKKDLLKFLKIQKLKVRKKSIFIEILTKI